MYRVEYDLDQHEEVVSRLLGIRYFNSGRARVQISGHQPICSICKVCGHFERECKQKKQNKDEDLNEDINAGEISRKDPKTNNERQGENENLDDEFSKTGKEIDQNEEPKETNNAEKNVTITNKFSPAKSLKEAVSGVQNFAKGFMQKTLPEPTLKTTAQKRNHLGEMDTTAERKKITLKAPSLIIKENEQTSNGKITYLTKENSDSKEEESKMEINGEDNTLLNTTQDAWDEISQKDKSI